MILIGQYDSPFVRRVGIALTLYGLPFEQRPWSVFGDPEKIRPHNPLTRVPTLVLDDGESLIESHCILDHLDSLVPADRAMFPRTEPDRRRALKVAALAMGTADKAVSLFYEQRLHQQVSDVWDARCRLQIASTLGILEADRMGRPGEHWFGGRLGHADPRRRRRPAGAAAGVPGDLAGLHPAGLRRKRLLDDADRSVLRLDVAGEDLEGAAVIDKKAVLPGVTAIQRERGPGRRKADHAIVRPGHLAVPERDHGVRQHPARGSPHR
ncbi:glutathione S-transferase family protein [Inquilinus sp.]|jgi:glutathione S-transferase|uniref:glutathione S-transferase family protein n=1 Tax=Inquilinus sp. TaxID=1932117 RepID=UPI003784E742